MLRRNLSRKFAISYKLRFKRIFLPIFFIGVFVFALWFLLTRSTFFVVKTISIDPDTLELVSTEDIKKILENRFLGKPILLPKKDLENAVYANFPVIKEVATVVSLPNTLVVKLREREPAAYIKTDFQEDYYIVDAEGFVLGVSAVLNKDLPLINYKGTMVFSGSILTDDKILSSLRFLEELRKSKIGVFSCTVTDLIVITTADPMIEVVIPVNSDERYSEEAILLQKIIQKYSIEGKSVRRIDLRFSNPIIDF